MPASAAPRVDLIDLVCRALAASGDPVRAVGQQRYMKSELPYRGVTSPELRALLRPILVDPQFAFTHRGEWEATVLGLWDGARYREERYAATALAGHRLWRRWQDPGLLPLLEHLIVTGAWWDHVDELATHHIGPILLRHRGEVTPVLRVWLAGDDLWLRRSAIIAQLTHKGATDLTLLTDAIEANIDSREFFLRKAIGWALRQHARTDPQWVRGFVRAREGRLSGLSRREALKHLGGPEGLGV